MESKLPFGRLTSVPLIDEEECLEIYSKLYNLKKLWCRWHIGKYTLGAATYLDANVATDANKFYYGKVKLFNPILKENFGWLYELLANVLAKELRQPTHYQETYALPGFHIFFPEPKTFEDRTLLHVDFQGRLLKWEPLEAVDFNNPISFTLAIKLPKCGGGLNVLDITYENYLNLSTEEQNRIISSQKVFYYPYKIGHLLIRSGDIFHEIAPMPHVQPGEERITLQGHGFLCQDTWHLYW